MKALGQSAPATGSLSSPCVGRASYAGLAGELDLYPVTCPRGPEPVPLEHLFTFIILEQKFYVKQPHKRVIFAHLSPCQAPYAIME